MKTRKLHKNDLFQLSDSDVLTKAYTLDYSDSK